MKRNSPIRLLGLAFIVFATLACMCSFLNPVTPLVIAPDEFPDAQAGTPYEAVISISQNRTPVGSILVVDGSLPPGLELVYVRGESTARISGTPEQAGTFAFTISVWCLGTNTSGQSAEFPMSITVKQTTETDTLVFIPDELPDAHIDVSYEAIISISNNSTPAGGYTLSEGTLPDGLALVYLEEYYSAAIIGTPTREGTFTFTISVWCYGTQESGQTGDKQYTLTVAP